MTETMLRRDQYPETSDIPGPFADGGWQERQARVPPDGLWLSR
jgi:hypothetical protein